MSIYKECDIRGIYGKEIDATTAYNFGRAVGTQMNSKRIAVGGDVRISTPILKEELIKGLIDSGVDVVDLGILPTPAFYFALAHLDVHGGITVTASHNPPQYNGFKLMFNQMPITPEDIKKIETLVQNKQYSSGKGIVSKIDIIPEYERALYETFDPGTLRLVLDCGNGSMSELAPRIFSVLGYHVIPLYCEFDGNFPNRDPNPAVYENLSDLFKLVIESKSDLGIAFDGDGDRVVFVDDKGQVIKSEQSFVIFINEYLRSNPSSVVYDLKSSSIVKEAILEMGGVPLIERSGHAFIKKRFIENNSTLAGEISGHFFFGELGYDDGLYAALKMAEIRNKTNEKLSSIINRMPHRVITPDIRLFCKYEERDAWLEKIRELGKKYVVSEIDGVRVEFPYGWLLVRKSVTEENITIRIEAKDTEAMNVIISKLLYSLPQLKEHCYFANIGVNNNNSNSVFK